MVLACSQAGDSSAANRVVVTGLVRSPGGSALASRTSSGPRVSSPDDTQRAEFPGLLPVPDGTTVELVTLDASGEPLEVLASSSTLAGRFRFELAPGITLDVDALAVLAGSGATRMRGWLAGTTADVDPLVEAALGDALTRGPLANLSDEERLDLVASIDLVARAEGVEPGDEVAEAVARFRNAALARPDFVAFAAAAASAPGTTTIGPGDLGAHFPLHVDDVRGYTMQMDERLFEPLRTIESLNLGATGELWTFRRNDALNDTGSETLVRRTSRALVRETGDDSFELFPDAPARLLDFPLRPGKSWIEADVRGTRFQVDVDSDGQEEHADVRIVRTVAGFEAREIAGESLECLRIDAVGSARVRTSHLGSLIQAAVEAHEWYAPGIGLVKRTLSADNPFSFSSFHGEELFSRRLEHVGRGILPPHSLTDLGRPLSCVLRPGFAYDGERSFVVTVVQGENTRTLTGYLLSPEGELERTTVLRALPVPFDCPNMYVPVTFDGTNYVVPFVENFRLVCVRVSRTGDLLDSVPLPISSPGQNSDFGPVIASDGTNSLVLWTRYSSPDRPQIRGALLAGDGSVLDEFVLLEGELNFWPQLAFGGGQYVVAWVHGYGNTVAAARITTAGELLDPTGIPLRSGLDYTSNEVALAFDGEQWLIVYTQEPVPNGPTQDLVARRLRADGTLVEPLDQPPIVLSTYPFYKYAPSALFDGTDWQIAWTRHYSVPGAIHLTRLSRDGVLVDGPSDSPSQTLVGPTEPSTPYYLVETLLLPGRDHSNLLWTISPRDLARPARLQNSRIFEHP